MAWSPINRSDKKSDSPSADCLTSAALHDSAFIERAKTGYVSRVRFKVIDFSDQELSRSRKEMEAILISKKIPRAKAEMAVIQTLNMAKNHCLEPMRRAGTRDELRRATSRLSTLIKLIESFVQLISKLPPRSKGRLNDIMMQQDLRNFDWGIFANIIHAIIDELSRTSPATRNRAVRVMSS
jgi:hypothetical protein